MAILLREEGLYDRSRIYATDINEVVLQRAKAGIFPLERMQEYTDNYIRAGGKRSFSRVLHGQVRGSACSVRSFTKNVVFSQHNLVTDRSFSEFNVILCRNVLIYFDKNAPDEGRTRLFYDSPRRCSACWCWGSKETLRLHVALRAVLRTDRPGKRIFRKGASSVVLHRVVGTLGQPGRSLIWCCSASWRFPSAGRSRAASRQGFGRLLPPTCCRSDRSSRVMRIEDKEPLRAGTVPLRPRSRTTSCWQEGPPVAGHRRAWSLQPAVHRCDVHVRR